MSVDIVLEGHFIRQKRPVDWQRIEAIRWRLSELAILGIADYDSRGIPVCSSEIWCRIKHGIDSEAI